MSEQTPNYADVVSDDRAATHNGQDGSRSDLERSNPERSDLERFGLGPEDQQSAGDDAGEILSGADATQERDSSLNRFGLGPEE